MLRRHEDAADGAVSALGTGGMITMINAAKIANKAGIDMVIMNGKNPDRLYDLFENKQIGTLFVAKIRRNKSDLYRNLGKQCKSR